MSPITSETVQDRLT